MDDDTIDTLREIVQDMTSTIDLISSGERGGNIIHFLEEMLKTIETWAAKYEVLLDDESLGTTGNSSIPIDTPSVPPVVFATVEQDQKRTDHVEPSLDRASMNANDLVDFTDTKSGEDQKTTESSLQSPGHEAGQPCEGSAAGDHIQASSRNVSSLKRSGGDRGRKAIISKDLVKEMETGGSDIAETDPMLATSNQVGNIVEVVASPGEVAPEVSERSVVDSPAWLPEGWITVKKARETGNTAGTKDKYFFDPVSKRQFRSKKEVLAFINRSNKQQMSEGRPKRLSRKDQAIDQNISTTRPADISQEESTNETRSTTVKLNIEHQESISELATDASEHPVVKSPSLPESSGSLIPNKPAQPSEWLVYENLPNLPYPMYEHMRLTENTTNKGNINSVPLAPWPWLYGNNETLKRSFVDNKADEDGKSDTLEETGKTEAVPKRLKKTAS